MAEPVVDPNIDPIEPPVADPTSDDPPPAPKPDPKPAPKPEPATPKVVTKELFDKLASEHAKIKRELEARMTTDELANAKIEEERMELEALRKERQIHSLEKALLKNGIAEGEEIAELFAAGETEKAIAALTKAKDEQIIALQKENTILKQRGALTPPVGEPPANQFTGKSLTELMKIANENPAMEEKIAAYLAAQSKKE